MFFRVLLCNIRYRLFLKYGRRKDMFYGLDWQIIYLAAAGAVGVLLLLLIIYIAY